DENCRDAAQGEDPPLDIDAIGVVLQPAVHDPPGDGNGDDQRNEDQVEEFFRKQHDQVLDGSAEDLADADLLRTLENVIGGQAQQAETGDADGEQRENPEGFAKAGVGLVLLVERFVEEKIIEGVVREEAVPGFFDIGDGPLGIRRVDLYGIIAADIGDGEDKQWPDGFLQAL